MAREKAGQGEPRGQVYDLLEGLEGASLTEAKNLFVMAGQSGRLAGGYFFEKESSEALGQLRKVEVYDQADNLVGTLPGRDAAFRAFYVSPPKWLEQGKKYKVKYPEVKQEELDRLYELRNQLLAWLKKEGKGAAEEFMLVGTAMGGVEEDPEKMSKKIGDQIKELLAQVGK